MLKGIPRSLDYFERFFQLCMVHVNNSAQAEAIQDYSGCAVIISHDRWFMDRVCTHILAFDGDSKVYWFDGGFSDYEENYKKRVGDIVPKRLKYKKLVRG